MRVAVLSGGISNEREVSLRSGNNVLKSLIRMDYSASLIDLQGDFVDSIKSFNVAFVAAQGGYGEDGCLQGLLECMRIPYTHSGVMATALAINKYASYMMFKSAGIPCPKSLVINLESDVLPDKLLPYPYIVKPVSDGSTVGVQIIDGDGAKTDGSFSEVLVSEYIPGRELTVGVIDGVAIGVLEVENFNKILLYNDKYSADRKTRYVCPAKIPPDIERLAIRYAEDAHKLLGCHGVTRVDMRYNQITGELFVLELNSNPAMTDTSMLPAMAMAFGINFDELVRKILRSASLHNSYL